MDSDHKVKLLEVERYEKMKVRRRCADSRVDPGISVRKHKGVHGTQLRVGCLFFDAAYRPCWKKGSAWSDALQGWGYEPQCNLS